MAQAETHLIYAGPTIPNGPRQGVVYSLPFLPEVQRAIEARPTLRGFFCPVDQFLEHAKKMRVRVGALRLPEGRMIKKTR